MKKVSILLIGCFLFGGMGKASANDLVLPKGEFYFGVLVPRISLPGDFDGNTVYLGPGTPPSSTVLVPDIDPAFGFGLTAGVKARINEKIGLGAEVSLIGSRHDYEQGALSGTAQYTNIMFDFKGYLRPRERVQPYLQFGAGVPTLVIEEGRVTSGGRSDATYYGINANMGAGLLFYLSRNVAFHAAGIYRSTVFDELEAGSRGEIDDKLTVRSLDVDLGMTFRFAPRGAQN